MNWSVDREKREAMSESGHRITWAKNKFGIWYNAYDRDGKHLEASYDLQKCKAACESQVTKEVA